MRTRFKEFSPQKFSFHQDPVLVLEEFWSPDERKQFQTAMQRSSWKALVDMPQVNRTFPNCGNWLKAELSAPERELFLNRMALPSIAEFIESFSNIKQRHMSFSYYSYSVGDCLSTHDDTGEDYARSDPALQGGSDDRQRSRQPFAALRRIAVVSYLHDEWQHDWGGELIIYQSRKGKNGAVSLEVVHCLEPKPGAVVFFTVPRFHRVCRVDPLAGDHKRLSISGWFMTEHFT